MISVPASFFIFALLLLRLPPFHARFRFFLAFISVSVSSCFVHIPFVFFTSDLSAHSRERRVPRSGFIRRFRLSHRFRFIENAIFHRIFQGRVISLGRSGFTGNPVFSGSQICEAKWTKFPVSALTDNLFPAHRLRDGRAIGLESLLF